MNRYYDSISNLPMDNWDLVHRTGEYKHLMKPGEKQDHLDLAPAWEIIFNEYIDEFGLDPNFKEWMKMKTQAAIFRATAYFEKNRTFLTMAEVKEEQARQLFGDDDGYKLSTVAAPLSKFMGFELDTSKISVKRFYSYLNFAKKKYGAEGST